MCTCQKERKVKLVKTFLKCVHNQTLALWSHHWLRAAAVMIFPLTIIHCTIWGVDNAAFLNKVLPCSLWDILWNSWLLYASFDACAFLIVQEGVNRVFPDNNQDSYSFLKWTLNGLLTDTLRGYDCLVESLGITAEFKHAQVVITTLQFHPANSNCERHSDFIDVKYEKLHLRIDEKW